MMTFSLDFTKSTTDPQFPTYCVTLRGARKVVDIATITRETMSGGGINMWGSRYRWAIRSTFDFDSRPSYRGASIDGVFTTYADTLTDAREEIESRLLNIVAAGSRGAWKIKVEPA